ncbi:MAG: hypothetical protein N2558_01730 [Patescibacteria group bacterium]|nr:hypothetical protein [Patescibacteria group bacterium]
MRKDIRFNNITKENVMIVFTTSPAGLGHIRVMEALRGELPSNVRSEILGVNDPKVQMMHRITSQKVFLRKIMEFLQTNCYTESIITKLYVYYLRKYPQEVYLRLLKMIRRRNPNPKVVVIVATHVSLAHQIAQIKQRLSLKAKTKIVLSVVVTDDTPLIIWAVKGADLIFVPSQKTCEYFSGYIKKFDSDKRPDLIVNAYPFSSKFCTRLSENGLRLRIEQLSSKSKPLNIMIPVSGAAVNLDYYKDIISYVTKKQRGIVTVVSRESGYTKDFLSFCEANYGVNLIADHLDRDVVLSYENAMCSKVFSLEITKPSEQSFKVLLGPNQVGGVIMLFSEPVGRQEYDNLSFMRRHGLIPSQEEQCVLDSLLESKEYGKVLNLFGEKAKSWRGIMLPRKGGLAARFILRYKHSGLFKQMSLYKKNSNLAELSDDGVNNFWKIIEGKLKNLV